MQNRTVSLICFFILFSFSLTIGQTVKIYHAHRNQSKFFLEGNDHPRSISGKVIRIPMREGSTAEIEIMNANGLLYQYSLKKEETEIQEDDGSIGSLMQILNELAAIVPDPGAILMQAKALSSAGPDFNDYIATINTLTNEVGQVKSKIALSDTPETIANGLIGVHALNALKNDLVQIQDITLPGHFYDPSLKETLDKLAAEATEGIADGIEKKFYSSAFALINETLVDKITTLRTGINTSKRAEFYHVTIGTKIVTCTINVLAIEGTTGTRATGELLTIEFVPYKFPYYEIVPVFAITSFEEDREYHVSNGAIVEQDLAEADYRIGVLAIINLTTIGEMHQTRLGVGAGFAWRQDLKINRNLFLGGLLSYRDFLKVGVGIGLLQYAAGLKDPTLIGGPLPPDVSNIESLIHYNTKPALVFTISFTGLKFNTK